MMIESQLLPYRTIADMNHKSMNNTEVRFTYVTLLGKPKLITLADEIYKLEIVGQVQVQSKM